MTKTKFARATSKHDLSLSNLALLLLLAQYCEQLSKANTSKTGDLSIVCPKRGLSISKKAICARLSVLHNACTLSYQFPAPLRELFSACLMDLSQVPTILHCVAQVWQRD